MNRAYWILLALSIAAAPTVPACSKNKPAEKSATGDSQTATDADSKHCATTAKEAVIGAKDGIHLIGRFYAAGAPNRPGIVLQHMIPPKNDRSNFSPEFIRKLVEQKYNVLNLDRRGAGESEGQAKDAYHGPLGAQDVQSAVGFLANQKRCPVDTSRMAFVGASNGTTSIWDYAVAANQKRREPKIINPKALVYLSGGTYTENQVKLSEGGAARDIPTLFLYPEREKEWNLVQKANAPNNWAFSGFAASAHGSRLLTAEPTAPTKIIEFLAAKLK